MSQDYVTRDEFRRFEERLAAERVAFETRSANEMKRFMGEVNGHIVRISEAAQGGRRDLIDSNQKMVEGFHRLEDHIERSDAGANRHRESTAQAVKDLRELTRTSIDKLGDQIEELQKAVREQAKG